MSDQYQAGNASLFAVAARKVKEDVIPAFVLAPLMSSFDGETYEVIALKYGEHGYRTTPWGRQTREWIAERNMLMGIDPATAGAFSICSISGNWSNYESGLALLMESLEKAVGEKNNVRN
jgi:hypothetical protein